MSTIKLKFCGKANVTPILHCFLQALVGPGIPFNSVHEMKINVLPTWGDLAREFERNASNIKKAYPKATQIMELDEQFEPSLYLSWLNIMSDICYDQLDAVQAQQLEDYLLLCHLNDNTLESFIQSDMPLTVSDLVENLRLLNDGHNLYAIETADNEYPISIWNQMQMVLIQGYANGAYKKVISHKMLEKTGNENLINAIQMIDSTVTNPSVAVPSHHLKLPSYMARAGFEMMEISPNQYYWKHAASATESNLFNDSSAVIDDIERSLLQAIAPMTEVQWRSLSGIRKSMVVSTIY